VRGAIRDAIALARSMGAKALELGSTMSLARQLDNEGNRIEAHAIVREIYGWFTDGSGDVG
jgi:hypothetical protein